ncbi:hypothetical protein AB2B38_001810 [Balneola sp. MJW-20]|uniref:hypothetical protein n=1 Tax=Gracilimonas aurantiaca TaxID=3234185 RepID=UPI0034652738
MKTILTFIVLIFGSTSLLFAQAGREEIYPDQVSINHNDAVKQFSRLFVSDFFRQGGFSRDASDLVGDSNRLSDVSIYGNNNTAEIAQLGLYNYANVGIYGNGNSVDIQQNGLNLAATLKLMGENNEFNLSQSGQNNTYYGVMLLADQIINRTQSGMNNTLVEFGIGSIPLNISQTGDAMQLIIDYNQN